MPDAEPVVGRRVPRAEAGTAERGADHCSRADQLRDRALGDQIGQHRLGGRVHRQRKITAAAVPSPQGVGRLHDIGVVAARAARDNPLLHLYFPVNHFIAQRKFRAPVRHLGGLLLHLPQDIVRIFI